jgi:hypothetical protein
MDRWGAGGSLGFSSRWGNARRCGRWRRDSDEKVYSNALVVIYDTAHDYQLMNILVVFQYRQLIRVV